MHSSKKIRKKVFVNILAKKEEEKKKEVGAGNNCFLSSLDGHMRK